MLPIKAFNFSEQTFIHMLFWVVLTTQRVRVRPFSELIPTSYKKNSPKP